MNRAEPEFTTPLEHEPGHTLVIPVRGIPSPQCIPKIPKDNIEYRAAYNAWLQQSRANEVTALELVSQPTAESCLFWINTFAWTYVVSKIEDDGSQHAIVGGGVNQPFVTWPVQDKIVREIINCILTGKNAVVDKSREMGLTWLILAVFTWFFLYHKGVNFLVMSRVEELVDQAGDPDTLFWKIDYMIAALPPALRPPQKLNRTSMKIVNPATGSTIVGKSTTGQQGRGGRKTAVLIDEAAAIRELKAIWVSMRHTTQCIIANSTPLGPTFFSKLVRSKQVHQLRAPWWDHPLKGRGRYYSTDENGQVKIRSPWYDKKVVETVDPMEIAQELDMDHQGAGYVVFPSPLLERCRAMVRPPTYIGEIDYVGSRQYDIALSEGAVRDFRFNDDDEGHWKLFCELERDEYGRWRPPQSMTPVFGIDISLGVGKSNSTIVVGFRETGEQVATYANARIDPAEFARLVVMAAYWWGGVNGSAFICPESNGPGQTFAVELKRLGAPWMLRGRDLGKWRTKKKDTIGFHVDDKTKGTIAGMLRRGMYRGEVIIRDAKILDEAGEYIYYDNGGIGPGELTTESPVALKTHGDRVVGMWMLHFGMLCVDRSSPPERVAEVHSPAFRRRRARLRADA